MGVPSFLAAFFPETLFFSFTDEQRKAETRRKTWFLPIFPPLLFPRTPLPSNFPFPNGGDDRKKSLLLSPPFLPLLLSRSHIWSFSGGGRRRSFLRSFFLFFPLSLQRDVFGLFLFFYFFSAVGNGRKKGQERLASPTIFPDLNSLQKHCVPLFFGSPYFLFFLPGFF